MGIVPEADDRLDPGGDLLGAWHQGRGRREAVGQGEEDPGVAEELGQGPAVGGDDGQAVEEGGDGRVGRPGGVEGGSQGDPDAGPGDPRVDRGPHEVQIPAAAEVEAAAVEGVLGLGFRDDEQGDVGAAAAEFVGDPGEGGKAAGGGRVEIGQVSMIARSGAEPGRFEEVGEGRAGPAGGLVKLVGEGLRGGDQGVGREGMEAVRAPVAEPEGGGYPALAAPREGLGGQQVGAVGEEGVGPVPVDEVVEDRQEGGDLGEVGLVREDGGASEQVDDDPPDVEAEVGRGVGPGRRRGVGRGEDRGLFDDPGSGGDPGGDVYLRDEGEGGPGQDLDGNAGAG